MLCHSSLQQPTFQQVVVISIKNRSLCNPIFTTLVLSNDKIGTAKQGELLAIHIMIAASCCVFLCLSRSSMSVLAL